MHLLVFSRAPGPLPPENLRRVFSFSFLLKFLLKNVRFGRSLAQLILAALSIYPFGIKGGRNGASLAMYPSVGFASQAQGYVSKEQRVLSDAPSGQFSEPLARRLLEICGGICPSVSF